MSSFDPKLEVQVVDDEIVVTLPGTSYSVTYYKMIGSPGLLAKRIVDTGDPRIPRMRVSEFLAKAWQLANDHQKGGLRRQLVVLLTWMREIRLQIIPAGHEHRGEGMNMVMTSEELGLCCRRGSRAATERSETRAGCRIAPDGVARAQLFHRDR
jgi:hypothetical protein